MSSAQQAFGCVGHTIRLASGTYIDLENPQVGDIHIEDIATGLANLCRFGGQIPEFYSVAEHCCHAVDAAASDGCNIEQNRAILLHDAAEAYCGDMVKPLKVLVGSAYDAVEDRLHRVIGERFGIDFEEHAEIVKKYDRGMLIAEKRFFCPDDRVIWYGEDGAHVIHPVMRCKSPRIARSLFIFHSLALGL